VARSRDAARSISAASNGIRVGRWPPARRGYSNRNLGLWRSWWRLRRSLWRLLEAETRQCHRVRLLSRRLSSTAAGADTSAADKALCEAIAPLMAQSTDIGKKFVNLGYSGTPERDNGIPQFRADVEDWAKRIHPIVDADPGPPRFLTRTLKAVYR